MDAVAKLAAVGALIGKIREAGITAPIEGPELRSLAEIVAAADGLDERIIVLGGDEAFTVGGRWPVHPMADGHGRARTGFEI